MKGFSAFLDMKRCKGWGPYSQSYDFSSNHVQMWELYHEEDWAPKNDAFELWFWRRLLSPLDSKKIKPVNPKGTQHWTFIGRADAEAEAPILWPPDAKSWLIRKDLMLGKTEGRRRRGRQKGYDRWMGSRVKGHEFEHTPGDGEGRGSLACCSLWHHKD